MDQHWGQSLEGSYSHVTFGSGTLHFLKILEVRMKLSNQYSITEVSIMIVQRNDLIVEIRTDQIIEERDLELINAKSDIERRKVMFCRVTAYRRPDHLNVGDPVPSL